MRCPHSEILVRDQQAMSIPDVSTWMWIELQSDKCCSCAICTGILISSLTLGNMTAYLWKKKFCIFFVFHLIPGTLILSGHTRQLYPMSAVKSWKSKSFHISSIHVLLGLPLPLFCTIQNCNGIFGISKILTFVLVHKYLLQLVLLIHTINLLSFF